MLNRRQVETILKPHLPAFESCFHDGMTDYSSKYDDTRPVHSRRTSSNILRDHIVDYARQVFGGREAEGIRTIDLSNGFFGIEIDGKGVGIDGCILVRFKKLDKRKLTRNVPTQQAVDFSEQKSLFALQVQPTLAGVGWERSNLNAGYVINDLRTDYEGLFVTFPNGKYKIDWFIDMATGAGGERNNLIEMLPPQPPTEEITKRVRPKGSKEQKEKDKEVSMNESNS